LEGPKCRAISKVNFIKRDRIVATRVSQEEYEELQRISREHGAQSVSDFVRRVITNHKSVILAAEAHSMAMQIDSLQQKVDWLTDIVSQNGPSRTAVSTATPADAKRNGADAEECSPDLETVPRELPDEA